MDNDLPATTDASVDVNPMAEGKSAEIKKGLKADLDKALEAGATPQFIRFILSCVSGLPGIGPVVGASSNFWGEQDQSKFNQILGAWLKMHEHEIDEIGKTMAEVAMRIDLNDEKVEARVRSPEYLSLVRKCFRDWAAAESEEKRTLIRNLLVNAAACEIYKDDVVKMFIGWIDHYTEPHFKVISTVYRLTNPTRQDIWL